ncbi:beta-3-deoxy-D-manno-oct-2-ulosonic acid transferase [Rhizobium sullae]|uniref:Beta-3-deoxy-D-manno-oct-2-ulosonic acid transferase n=1 Tax=Rhizobium sullae TaxID=50338 RepID=A0A2N0D1Q2_RHISU|nr:beta-3-deoxy-D-manno-oct-2-ulosonic acid transferase [Rhizobium sullae]
MHDWFPDHKVIFAPMQLWPIDFAIDWKWRVLADRRSRVLAWQYKGVPQLKRFCRKHAVPFQYVEDGFIRSIALGAHAAPPMSLAFDAQDMYFNANVPTDLEDLLATYDFDSDTVLMERARKCIERQLAAGLSKYNQGERVSVEAIYGAKTKRRILVIGQVERDASIQYGSIKKYSNNDLVWIAVRENPNAQIIYKPHPEVLQGTADAMSDPDAVRGAALVLDMDISLSDALQTIDHVYTITSLAGFESLLRGIKVTALGCPFYSGWGVTDDRQPNKRRGRKLTAEQIFAAAYILYPRYFDPVQKEPIEIERALDILSQMRALQPRPDQLPAKEDDPLEDLVIRLSERLQATKKRKRLQP